MNIAEKAYEIINKYECYGSCYKYRYDENDNEFEIIKELKDYFNSTHIKYKMDYKENAAYYSCFAISWVEDGEIKLITRLVELLL